jgi:hypothetical protein
MDHFGGHVIESARAQLGAFAFACQHSLSGNHGVRLVSGMPMLSDVDRFRGADEHAGSMRCRINTKKTNFRGFFSEIGNNLVLFQIGHIFENRPIARRRRRLGCLRTKAGQRQQCQRRRTERSNLVFMIGSIDLTFQFHKKSYAAVALIRVRGPGIIDPGYSESMNQIDESVRETE